MASAVRQGRPDRDGSCFSRAARAIWRALSRICRDSSPSIRHHAESEEESSTSHSKLSEDYYSALSHKRRDHIKKSAPSPVRRPFKQGLKFGFKKEKSCLLRPTPTPDFEVVYPRRRGRLGSARDSPVSNSVLQPQGGRIRNRVHLYSPATEGSQVQDKYEFMSLRALSKSRHVRDVLVNVEAVVTAEKYSATNAQPTRPHLQMSSGPGSSKRDSSCLPRSHSVPSLSQTFSAKNKTFKRSQSLPDMLLKSSFEEFTPESWDGAPSERDYCNISEDMYDDVYDTRKFLPLSTAGPSSLHLSSSDDDDDSDDIALYGKRARMDWMSGYDEDTTSVLRAASCGGGGYFPTTPSQTQGQTLHPPDRKDTDDGGPSFDSSSSTFSMPTCSQSTAPTFFSPPCPHDRPVVPQDSTVCTEGSGAQEDDVLMEMETSDTAVNYSVTNNQSTHSHLQLSSSNPGWTERDSSGLSRSHSVPSLSQTTCPENKTFTRSQSLPDLLKSSFEDFTPEISVDEDDETYRFQCSCPGLYQCSVTGLVFHMEAEGDVVYRTVPWDRRLLAQHHKQPAGPLFDIKCLQQSVCQLHLPHCEIRSTGGCEFLSVAHVNDESIEFIVPQKITETHVIINITGFSGFGNVKDEDSPPDPVRALVLLFYRPPADPDPESLANVLLLPVNIVLRDVVRTRKKLVGDEIYIETSSHCKLRPKQEYTLSTCPEDDSVLVQPTEAEFDCDNYDNYFPSFQVILEKIMKHIKLFLRENKSSKSVWERRVCLSSTAVKRSCGPSALNLPPNNRLLDIRSSFIDGISGPVLKTLLDKLLEKTVLTDSERESADEVQNHRDKARFVLDTVRKKGEAASSEMIEFLCELDPFLCEHLGLI